MNAAFPLAAVTNYLQVLKQAAEVYAPPDTSGELEGAFTASQDEVVQALLALLENELKTGYAYHAYSNMLRDYSHFAVAEEFQEHASQELAHAEYLMRRLSVMAGSPPLPDIPAPPSFTDPQQIFLTMIRMEQEGIAKWRLLRSLIGDENPMRFQVEEFLTREQEHLDQLWQMLPPEMRAAAKSPAPQMPAAPGVPPVPGTKMAAKIDPEERMRGPLVRGTYTQDPSRVVPADLSFEEAAKLMENPDHFSEAEGHHFSPNIYHEGQAGQTQEQLLRGAIAGSRIQAFGQDLRDAPLGALGAGTLLALGAVATGRSPSNGATLGTLGVGASLPVIHAIREHHARVKALEADQKDLVAPIADPGSSWEMERSTASRPGLGRIALRGLGIGTAINPHASPGMRIVGGTAALGDTIAGLGQSVRHGAVDITEGRARKHVEKLLSKVHEREGIPPVPPTAAAAEGEKVGALDIPPLPMSLSPEASGSLARLSTQPSGDGGTGVPEPMEEMGTGLPEIPEGVDPGEMDLELLEQMQREEQGRQQENQAAADYYQQQAQATSQQAQQLQQQLEQMVQEKQQLEQQLQNEQAQKQQAQQMAQQASDTATQSLGQQLQMQQQALQSRQQTTQVLTQHDALRQQLREVIDPPPVPPAGMEGGAPGAAPAPGQPAPAQGGAPPVPPAGTEPPKTASIRDLARMAVNPIGDYQEGGATRLVLRSAIPAAAGIAAGAVALSKKPEQREEAVIAGRKALDAAETAFSQKRDYRNAVQLLRAKGGLAAAEINAEFPRAAALATATATYGTARSIGTGAESIRDSVKTIQARMKPRPANNQPPIFKKDL